jgi:tetratricopeptide (TPR) repeat protein
MRASLLLLVAMARPPWLAGVESCAGIEAQLRAVSTQLDRGDDGSAERALGPLEAAHPGCADVVLDRARVQAAKREASAEDTFVRYTNLRPRDAQGYAYYSRFLLDQGEYQRADALSIMASSFDENNPLAMAVRGQILDMKGKSQEGIELLEKAIRLNPEDAEAKFQLGSMEDRAMHPKQAVQYFAEYVEMIPSDARGWDYLALNLEPLGEIDRAQQAYQKALAVNRGGAHFDAFLPYNYGRFLMKRNQFSASKEQLDRAVELTPQVRAAWYERARLEVLLKNYAQARADAEKAASLEDPQGVIAVLQVYVLLEQVYTRLGETKLARKYADLGRVTPAPVRSDTR